MQRRSHLAYASVLGPNFVSYILFSHNLHYWSVESSCLSATFPFKSLFSFLFFSFLLVHRFANHIFFLIFLLGLIRVVGNFFFFCSRLSWGRIIPSRIFFVSVEIRHGICLQFSCVTRFCQCSLKGFKVLMSPILTCQILTTKQSCLEPNRLIVPS
jgi:hypothetical protein